jgi:hypothetical protein
MHSRKMSRPYSHHSVTTVEWRSNSYTGKMFG